MARDRSPKGAQGSQKPPTAKGGSYQYQVRGAKGSGKATTVSDKTGAYQVADATKHDKGSAASALRQVSDRKTVGRAIEKTFGHRVIRTTLIDREGQIPVKLLSTNDSKPADVVARVELRRMVDQLPAEKLQQAIEALKGIMAPTPHDNVVAATDAELEDAAGKFMLQYQTALERLAKR